MQIDSTDRDIGWCKGCLSVCLSVCQPVCLSVLNINTSVCPSAFVCFLLGGQIFHGNWLWKNDPADMWKFAVTWIISNLIRMPRHVYIYAYGQRCYLCMNCLSVCLYVYLCVCLFVRLSVFLLFSTDLTIQLFHIAYAINSDCILWHHGRSRDSHMTNVKCRLRYTPIFQYTMLQIVLKYERDTIDLYKIDFFHVTPRICSF